KPPSPLPEEIVSARQKAGGFVGWMGPNSFRFVPFRADVKGQEGEVPAFQFREWEEGVIGNLPQPQAAFGLSLGGKPVTEAGLKELAGLKSLQTLYLSGPRVTDVGLKELAGLNSLQTLDLSGAPVTDAGLKGLAGLKSLQMLRLSGAAVTGVGL